MALDSPSTKILAMSSVALVTVWAVTNRSINDGAASFAVLAAGSSHIVSNDRDFSLTSVVSRCVTRSESLSTVSRVGLAARVGDSSRR